MPILEVDESHSVIVIKRSMNPGFAGIENELYYDPKTAMLFGDAKSAVGEITAELGADLRASAGPAPGRQLGRRDAFGATGAGRPPDRSRELAACETPRRDRRPGPRGPRTRRSTSSSSAAASPAPASRSTRPRAATASRSSSSADFASGTSSRSTQARPRRPALPAELRPRARPRGAARAPADGRSSRRTSCGRCRSSCRRSRARGPTGSSASGLNLYDVMSVDATLRRGAGARRDAERRPSADAEPRVWSPERHRVISGEEVVELLPALAAREPTSRLPLLRLPDRRRAPRADRARRGRALRRGLRQPARGHRAASRTTGARAACACATARPARSSRCAPPTSSTRPACGPTGCAPRSCTTRPRCRASARAAARTSRLRHDDAAARRRRDRPGRRRALDLRAAVARARR